MKYPSVEISILCYNQWASTLRLLRSIVRETQYTNYKLIIVDNASTDSTTRELNDLQYKKKDDKKLIDEIIINNENLGFAKGHNQVIEKSNADYVCLLNNDIEVTKNWLTNLVNEAEMDSRIGIISPINITQGRLIIGGHLFKDGNGKHIHNDERDKEEIDWLQFSCVLIKRKVIDLIGGLDEIFSPGYYEDVDYCLRARELGFKLVCSKDVIVEHYDGVTSKPAGLKKYQKINKEKFIKKWKNWLKLK